MALFYNMKENVFIVDYAYGFNAKTCETDYVSVLRSKAALRAFKKYPFAKIVLGAGMKKATGDCGPLSSMMRDYLITQGVPADSILENPHGHDTLTETKVAWDIIKRHGGGEVVCATSAYHSARVWCIWVCGFGVFPLAFYVTNLNPSHIERVKELLKTPLDAFRALKYRFDKGV